MKLIWSLKRKLRSSSPAFLDLITILMVALTALLTSLWIFRETLTGLFSNKIPLAGDGLLTGLYIRTVEKSGYLDLLRQNIVSDEFGWPGQLNFASYPVGNLQEMLGIKIFMDLTGITNPSQIIHIFSISKAAPIAIATFLLARLLKIPRIHSFLIGVAYSASTYNLIRAEGHFFLALTWSIPLGIACIYLGFRSSFENLEVTKRTHLMVIAFGISSFLTGFYYSIFLIILAFASFALLLLKKFREARETDFSFWNSLNLKKLFIPFYIILIYILGFLVQTVPVLIQGRSILKITGLADRSFVESIIYAGTPESLLFDFYAAILRVLNRPDLVAYLQSRISWEGSQVGALSGLVFALILLFLFCRFVGKILGSNFLMEFPKVQKNVNFKFVTYVLFVSLIFYFVSPINFAVSRVLPQIRAWGRFSTVITLLTLIFLGILITRRLKSNLLVSTLVLILFAIPIFEVQQFRQNRPTSIDLNETSKLGESQNDSTMNALKREFKSNCALINLPLYPFPEFDRPDDKNIDYGQLQLPLSALNDFKWSYAGIKGTQNFEWWQQLISEFPPFARSSLQFQINYSRASGACGAVIDTTYLTMTEAEEMTALSGNKLSCLKELSGEKNGDISRYISINFNDRSCWKPVDDKMKIIFQSNSSGKFLWRLDQSSTSTFVGPWQVFDSKENILLRLIINPKFVENDFLFKVKIISNEKMLNDRFEICFEGVQTKISFCSKTTFNSQGEGVVKVPYSLKSGRIERLKVSLKSIDAPLGTRWGIIMESKN